MKKIINWKLFFILLLASVFGTLAILPYIFTIQSNIISEINIPLPQLILLQILQTTILFAVIIFLGLLSANKVGFKIPVLTALLKGSDFKKPLVSGLRISIISGILVAGIIIILDWIFMQAGVTLNSPSDTPELWKRFLAAFYGGISEEVMMRLFLVSVISWILLRLIGNKTIEKSNWVVLSAILFAAIVFGIGHIPVTAIYTEITPLVIARAILLNGIGGIVFGLLYWKKGFEFAVISHFTADILLLVVIPSLIVS